MGHYDKCEEEHQAKLLKEKEEREARWAANLIPEKIVLSDRDYDKFLDAIENPPEPNEKLKKLFKTHEAWMDAEDDINPTVRKAVHVQANKEVKGKAEGARFCFFSSLPLLSKHYMDTTIDYLCMHFDDLVYMSPMSSNDAYINKIHDILDCIENSVDDVKGLYDDVIAVRHHAILSGKYHPESYKKGVDHTLLLDAIARHLIAYMFVDPIDPESNKSHLAHVVANLAMIVQMYRGKDNEIQQ